MAQNISLWGANYQNCPAVDLPKQGGGTARFTDVSDTTAAASDVATGKYFYDASGIRTAGTNSGGGGASNIVQGTFTCGTSTGTTGTVSIPYTGTGYPIAAMVFVSGGAYNSAISAWYNSSQRYAVGQWTFSKSVQTSTPTWTTSGAANQGVTTWVFKNTSSSSYSRSSAMNTNVLTSSSTSATGAGATCVRFNGNGKTLSYYVASTSYGLLAGLEYQYIIIYSS